MSEPSPGTIELTCPGCAAYFRLKPKKGKYPKGPIPCPKCGTSIPLNLTTQDDATGASEDSSPKSSTDKASTPGSGVFKRSAAISPSRTTQLSNKSTSDDPSGTDFLRVADQLLDTPAGGGLNSTYQGFGITQSLRQTRENKELENLVDKEPENKLTSTSNLFSREEATKDVDPRILQELQNDQKAITSMSETPHSGVDMLGAKTPMHGMEPVNPFMDLDEPGPFDMRDIVEAERSKLDDANPNEITHNPLLDSAQIISRPAKPKDKPLPESPFGIRSNPRAGDVGDNKTVVHAEDDLDDVPTANSEPLASRSDIFTDVSIEPLSEVADDKKSEPETTTGKEDSTPVDAAKPKPLAAMLRKKISTKKLDSLKTSSLPEQSSPRTMMGLPSITDLEDSIASTDFFAAGADEDELDKVLAEAENTRISGEHPAAKPMLHPTKPSFEVSKELSQRLSALKPPSKDEAKDDTKENLSVGENFKRRIENDRSEDLEPGKPPEARGSSLLARLKPKKQLASLLDQTSEIPVATQQSLLSPKSSPELPDEASIVASDSPSGNFQKFALTPESNRSNDGISWASSESVVSFDDAPSVVRKRHRQESHSGLFPISGGLGQEDSVGMAGERRGSGYIRLPTSEIIDVLGQGQYRLLVEDIVYEPVDERGLTELVKRGVILGAEKIADPGGEWRPINEHPVFRRLKKKMAIEAHSLLAKYRSPSSESSSIADSAASDKGLSEPSDKSNTATPALGDFSNPSESMVERLEEIPADFLDEDSSQEEINTSTAAPPALPDVPEPQPVSQTTIEVDDDDFEEGLLEAIADPESSESSDPFDDFTPQDSSPEEEHEEEQSEPEEEPPAVAEQPSTPFEEELSEEDPLTPPSGGKGPLIAVGALIIAGTLITAGVLYTQPDLRQQLFGTPTTEQPVTSNNTTTEPAQTNIGPAITQAHQAIAQALPNLNDKAKLIATASALALENKAEEAKQLFQLSWMPDSPIDATKLYAKTLKETNDFQTLREVATSGLASGTHQELFQSYKDEALRNDPSLKDLSPTTITKSSHGDTMTLSPSGQGLVFKLTDAQGQVWAFHPEQQRYKEDAWKKDVTAWRLCQLIACTFDIPQATPAVIDAAVFDHLMSSTGSGAKPPSERFSELSWNASRDKAAPRQLRGVLKRWVEPGAMWPFSYTNTWRPWVTAYEDKKALQEPLAKALENMSREDEPLYKAILAQTGQSMDTKELATQLSGVVTFDFLVNNMNRFKERATYNNAPDNQITRGNFYSLDHSTTMASRLSSRVKGRFDWVQRFDKSMIDAIRDLDPKTVDPILFPKGTSISRSEQKAFWKRRERLLKEVDELVARYGKENVYFQP